MIVIGDLIETIHYDYPDFHLEMTCFWAEVKQGSLTLKEAREAKWLTAKTIDSVDWLPADLTLVATIKGALASS